MIVVLYGNIKTFGANPWCKYPTRNKTVFVLFETKPSIIDSSSAPPHHAEGGAGSVMRVTALILRPSRRRQQAANTHCAFFYGWSHLGHPGMQRQSCSPAAPHRPGHRAGCRRRPTRATPFLTISHPVTPHIPQPYAPMPPAKSSPSKGYMSPARGPSARKLVSSAPFRVYPSEGTQKQQQQ